MMWDTGTIRWLHPAAFDKLRVVIVLFRLIERLTNGHKFIGSDPLDLIKFICKEFWEEIFKKKVINLTIYE